MTQEKIRRVQKKRMVWLVENILFKADRKKEDGLFFIHVGGKTSRNQQRF